jgi:DNA-binding protein H-NS
MTVSDGSGMGNIGRDTTTQLKAAEARHAGEPDRSGLPLETLTDRQLSALIDAARSVLDARRKQERQAFLEEVKQRAEQLGLHVDELAAVLRQAAPPADRRRVVQPKYRHPSDPHLTWSGRGSKPRWLQELLTVGRTLGELRVTLR